MPDFTLSDAIQEAYASAPSAEVILPTLELRHPDFPAPVRVVRDHADLTATLEATAPANPGESVTFAKMSFDFVKPEVQQSALPEVTISLDGASAELIPYLDAAANSVDATEVTYREYLASDTSGPQMDPPLTLEIQDVHADLTRVTAKAGYANLANRKFPAETYDSNRFPGLAPS